MSRPVRADSGFALVELLAALVLLAMLGAMIAAATAPGLRAWESTAARTRGQDAAAAAQGLLRERLSRLAPIARAGAGALTVETDVTGEPDSLDFEAPGPQAAGAAELQHWRLMLDRGGDLVLRSRSDLADDPDFTRRDVVLRGVQAIELSYYGVAPPDGEPRWRSRWPGSATAPELVRLRLAFAPGDRRLWPELDVRPQATTDSSCVIDPRDGRCRGRA